MDAPKLIKLPPVRVRFDYVMIVEWLQPQDQRTGHLLHEHLREGGVSSRVVSCQSSDDVVSAIADGHTRISRDGLPAIHLETHGAAPSDDVNVDTAFGANGESLTWDRLGIELAPLNEASDFQLLLVAASCFGAAAEAAMGKNIHVAPFAACIGFTTSVDEGSLLRSMQGMYSAIKRGSGLREAVATARENLLYDDENIELRTALMSAYQVLRGVDEKFRTPEAVASYLDGLLRRLEERGIKPRPDFEQVMPSLLDQRRRFRMQEAWDIWFPKHLQERNETYRLQWDVVEL